MKLFTSICMLAGLALLFVWPTMFVSRPTPQSPRVVRRAYAEKFLLLSVAQVLTLIGAGVGSALIVRRAREEYQEETLRNLQRLVESASQKSEE